MIGPGAYVKGLYTVLQGKIYSDGKLEGDDLYPGWQNATRAELLEACQRKCDEHNRVYLARREFYEGESVCAFAHLVGTDEKDARILTIPFQKVVPLCTLSQLHRYCHMLFFGLAGHGSCRT